MHLFNFAALFTVLATFTATAAASVDRDWEFEKYNLKNWRPKSGSIAEETQENAGHRRGGAEYFTSGSPSVVAQDYSAKKAPTRFEQWQSQKKASNKKKESIGINGSRRTEDFYP
ncbi:uncharacterized protein PpBr36_11094 [Pyricularia pennisetigena]|uniref:uncharacterized protein n=1 Tax=Pyricularia pennisetigena TaxID=1578925 RepID=UPI0011504FBF|nr:uncharacterized protein PpBr36_11094 [Pyricularia pennisetigena]TLS20601.1 hypothetical protein PpBr36_11094 [Pyricularia pennisetigena]